MPSDQTDNKSNDIRRLPLQVPKGGFTSNAEEARWLADTIAMRFEETIADRLGVRAEVETPAMEEVILLVLNDVSRRARKEALEALRKPN